MKNKNYLIILIIVFLANCSQPVEEESSSQLEEIINVDIEIPTVEIDKSKLLYNTKNSLWTLESEPFSGYATSRYPDKSLKQKFGVYKGKKQGKALEWYPDGHFKYLANYYKGKLHGQKKFWISEPTHTLVSHLNYYLGKAHGEQKKWYSTGEIFKILQLNMGKEEGIQRAFRKNGELFANYEAKEGRIFGLKKSALCYELEGENIKRKD